MTTNQAIGWAGGNVSELARRLGISRQAIYLWGKYPPDRMLLRLHYMSLGSLKPTQAQTRGIARRARLRMAQEPLRYSPPER